MKKDIKKLVDWDGLMAKQRQLDEMEEWLTRKLQSKDPKDIADVKRWGWIK